MPKEIEKGPFGLVWFCMLRLKVKEERGPFAISIRWQDLALIVSIVSVKSGPFSVRPVV